MKSLNFKKSQAGFTLVELGIVVGIAAVIIGLSLTVVPGLLATTRANAEISEVTAIVAKIQRTYTNQSNYATATTPIIASVKAFPDNEVAGSVITNRWGGLVTIAPTTLASIPNAGLNLTYASVPTAECLLIVQGVERTMRVITVNGVIVKADGANFADPALTGTNCNAQTLVPIIYTIGK